MPEDLRAMASAQPSVPNPDPTVLTTQQLNLALSGLRDYVHGEIKVLEERLRGIDVATDLLNESVNRVPTDLQLSIGRMQDLVNEKFKSIAVQFIDRDMRASGEVARTRDLIEEKFHSIEVQFAERDTRQERESRDNKIAVDAAFAAQKEAAATQDSNNTKAIDKSEKATAETISKLQDLTAAQALSLSAKIDEGLKTIADKIDDLKDGTIADLKSRLGQVEGNRGGQTEHSGQIQAQSAIRSQQLAAIAGIFLVLVTIASILVFVLTKKP
jgi:hypothetical protein